MKTALLLLTLFILSSCSAPTSDLIEDLQKDGRITSVDVLSYNPGFGTSSAVADSSIKMEFTEQQSLILGNLLKTSRSPTIHNHPVVMHDVILRATVEAKDRQKTYYIWMQTLEDEKGQFLSFLSGSANLTNPNSMAATEGYGPGVKAIFDALKSASK